MTTKYFPTTQALLPGLHVHAPFKDGYATSQMLTPNTTFTILPPNLLSPDSLDKYSPVHPGARGRVPGTNS